MTPRGRDRQALARRVLDVTVATAVLLLLSPLMLAIAFAILLLDGAPVLHRASRVGLGGRTFTMHKFRTMVRGAEGLGPAVTMGDDPRITPLGGFLRRWKLDELPQLLNVVGGEMSLVGPRPEDARFVAGYTVEQRMLLSVRPGMTSPASILFRDEQSLLVGSSEQDYVERVLPAKLALELAYLARRSLARDVNVLVTTAARLLPSRGVARWVRRHVPWLVTDSITVVVAFIVALELRFVDATAARPALGLRSLLPALPPIVALFLGVNHVWGLNRRIWKYAVAADVTLILNACAASTILALLADLATGARNGTRALPVSVVVLGGLLTFTGLVVSRYRLRLAHAVLRGKPDANAVPTRTLIYGGGDVGQLVAWRLRNQPEGRAFRLVGFVDDDPDKIGLLVHGLPILGARRDLPALVGKHQVELVIVAVSGLSGEELRDIVTQCERTDALIRLLPNFFELVRSGAAPLLREVTVEDLLGKRTASVEGTTGVAICEGRVVVVTGASGSVGAELCQQVARCLPARLVALDSNESGLYDLGLELRARFPRLKIELVVADVADSRKMDALFAQHRPGVVLHAAAYKHVPMMESFPEEAIRTNVLGTCATLEAARRHKAERFVLVSTDKAVNPISVMGASKRAAELLVLATQGSTGTLCTAVRFGNVLGSRGSVVPTFARQIELGGPVTVTDPDMTRFFMGLSEAAELILQAAELTCGADIFMLEMGERIRIDDLARKMIRLRGLRPGIDIPITYVGVRPGEKVHEELMLTEENVEGTRHPAIHRVLSDPVLGKRRLAEAVAHLGRLAAGGDRAAMAAALIELCRSATSLREPAAGDDLGWPGASAEIGIPGASGLI